MSIKKKIIYSGLNLSIRFASLVPKLLFSIFCVKFLSLEEFGEYIIFISGMSFVLLFIGFDFYTFANRELLLIEDCRKGNYLSKQLLTASTSALFLLIIASILMCFFIGTKYIVLFYMITFLEYLSTEIYRILTILSKQVLANALMFVRSGLWIIVLLLIWFFSEGEILSQSISTILWIQFAFAFIGCILSLGILNRIYALPIRSSTFFNSDYIVRGLKISLVFYLITFLLKSLELSGRFIIDSFGEKEMTGVFGFATQIGISIQIIISSSVTLIEYPKLIIAENSGDDQSARKIRNNIIISSSVLMWLCLVGLYFFQDLLFFMIGNETLLNYKHILWMSCISNIIFIYALIFQFVLYSKNMDRVILYSMVKGFFVYCFLIPLLLWLLPNLHMEAVLIAQCVAFTCILLDRIYQVGKKDRL